MHSLFSCFIFKRDNSETDEQSVSQEDESNTDGQTSLRYYLNSHFNHFCLVSVHGCNLVFFRLIDV